MENDANNATSWKTKTTKLAPTIIYKTTHYAVFQPSSQLITNGTPGTPTGKPQWINWNFKMNEDGKRYWINSTYAHSRRPLRRAV